MNWLTFKATEKDPASKKLPWVNSFSIVKHGRMWRQAW